jgi:hypothetical protein
MFNGNPYVVHNSTNEYVKLTDNSLKREFESAYVKERNIKGRYWSPIADMRAFEALMGLYASSINPFEPYGLPLSPTFQTPSMDDVLNTATIRHYENLIRYYKQYNIIK